MLKLVKEDDSIFLLQMADSLAQTILKQLVVSRLYENPHAKAIMVTEAACKFLQATYQEKETLDKVLEATSKMLKRFAERKMDA